MPVGAGFIPARIGENKKMTEHKKLQPEIRFAGFTDDWEQRKLGDVVEIIGGGTPDTNNTAYWNGNIDWYSPTEIGNKPYVSGSLKKISVLGLQKSSAKILPANKTILFTSRAGIGDMAILTKQGTTNQGFQSFILKNDVDIYFLYSMGFKIKDFALKNASGSTFLEISKSQLSQMKLYLPSLKEQTQIGNFFKQLDDTIALHQRELEKFKILKTSYLENIFLGKVLLFTAKNTITWEQRKLGDVFGKIRNAFVGTATPYYVTSGHFYLESNNIKNGQINRDSEIFINEYFYQKQKDKWLKSGDMVMVQSGHVGHTAIIPDELHNSIAHALIMFTDYLDKSVPYFFNFFFQTNKAKREIDKITTGNTVKHILASDMKDFPIFLPSYEEQTQIGNFFKQLDDTIALHQREVEKYKKIKQSYLENMFI